MSNSLRDALLIVQDALTSALTPLVDTWNGTPAVFWRTNPAGAVGAVRAGELDGFIAVQPPADGGKTQRFIGMTPQWTGSVTLRCLAKSDATARALFASIPEPLALAAEGYDIQAVWQGPLDQPVTGGLSMVAGIYRISLAHT